MSISDGFKVMIDKVVASSLSAHDTATHFMSYESTNLSDPPIHILNDSVVSKINRDAIILKEHVTKLISKHFGSALSLTVSITVSYFLFKWLLKALDPTTQQKKNSQNKVQFLKLNFKLVYHIKYDISLTFSNIIY